MGRARLARTLAVALLGQVSLQGASAQSPTSARFTGQAGAILTANDLVVDVVFVGADSSVLRLRPA